MGKCKITRGMERKNMNFKQHANMFLVFVLLFSLFAGAFPPVVNAAGDNVSVTVIGNDQPGSNLPETNIAIEGTASAFDALVNAVGAENVLYDTYPSGKFITEINGLKQTDNYSYYWSSYVNGISLQVSADKYFVQNGDKVSYIYTDYPSTQKNTVSLKVVGKDGSIISESPYPISIVGEPTAFQLLQVYLGPDKVTYEQYDFGKMITSINGIKAEGTNFWAFYINGQSASVGADSYQLKAGDQISFQLESWAPPVEEDPGDENTNPPGEAISKEELQMAIDQAIAFIPADQVAEWEAVAINKAGKEIPATYLEKVINTIKEKQGTFRNITDYERYTLGILAAGGDPTNVAGYNLISSIYNGNVTKQGLIGVAYALLALDSANFQIPESAVWTREKLINYLIERQNSDSGWAWDGSTSSDLDTTAMILSALAPYKDQAGIKEKINSAVNYLSTNYLESKIDNSSTAAQVIIALSALGIDPNGELFTKDGSSIVSYLLTFKNEDNGFGWKHEDASSVFTTSQALQALVAYQLKLNGKGSLYNLPLAPQNPVTEQPVKEAPKVDTPETAAPEAANTKAQDGKRLPDTATNMYELLLMGMLLMVIGAGIYMLGNRRKA